GVIGVVQSQHDARILDQRMLKAAASAKKRPALLARELDAAQRAFHTDVWASRHTPQSVKGRQSRGKIALQLLSGQPSPPPPAAKPASRKTERPGDRNMRRHGWILIADQAYRERLHKASLQLSVVTDTTYAVGVRGRPGAHTQRVPSIALAPPTKRCPINARISSFRLFIITHNY